MVGLQPVGLDGGTGSQSATKLKSRLAASSLKLIWRGGHLAALNCTQSNVVTAYSSTPTIQRKSSMGRPSKSGGSTFYTGSAPALLVFAEEFGDGAKDNYE